MKAKAAVMWGPGEPFSVEEIELDPPQEQEVLVRIEAAGLCHSDDHARTGDAPANFPVIGGHEGSGVIEQVGPGVLHHKVGDHVVFSFTPVCGRCHWCSTGRQNLCDFGALIGTGQMISGGVRTHARGRDLGPAALLGTFSSHVVVNEANCVKLDEDIPFDVACLLGCGVPTGWGSAVRVGQVQPGETVVVVGIGGIGANALQGARLAGAKNVVAVDPVSIKHDKAKTFGATHTASSFEEARELVSDITRGVMADVAILTVGVVRGTMMEPFLDLVSKGGRAVLTGVAPFHDHDAKIPLQMFAMYEKQLRGTVFGGCNPRADIPLLASLYRNGQLQLDELITTRYALEDINLGYQDMLAGKNIRGIVVRDA